MPEMKLHNGWKKITESATKIPPAERKFVYWRSLQIAYFCITTEWGNSHEARLSQILLSYRNLQDYFHFLQQKGKYVNALYQAYGFLKHEISCKRNSYHNQLVALPFLEMAFEDLALHFMESRDSRDSNDKEHLRLLIEDFQETKQQFNKITEDRIKNESLHRTTH